MTYFDIGNYVYIYTYISRGIYRFLYWHIENPHACSTVKKRQLKSEVVGTYLDTYLRTSLLLLLLLCCSALLSLSTQVCLKVIRYPPTLLSLVPLRQVLTYVPYYKTLLGIHQTNQYRQVKDIPIVYLYMLLLLRIF